MSGLTKKRVRVDENLGLVVGVPEGAAVSYAEIQKGLHKYIRDNNLRIDVPKGASAVAKSSEPERHQADQRGTYCISCGEAIPSGSIFCDLCGTLQ